MKPSKFMCVIAYLTVAVGFYVILQESIKIGMGVACIVTGSIGYYIFVDVKKKP